ncbi:hypothetical protein LTR62_005629 [Meristemomyces frigidus]|uniref:Ima1 N-terminal domain-containing protein n=1 Tax=Meristemomyces frigidus TaxID=1508187 RepID=A0AAN7YF87_9PEZI|nr:hypothetical protein LTR62_005629 [Meristemomyces frigidus]
MFFFGKLTCHYCNIRSTISASSGVDHFQCTYCEAVNYLDPKGNIIDIPASVAEASHFNQHTTQHTTQKQTQPFQTFTHELPETLQHQQSQAFCNACQTNQLLYMESLANYLPDEEDPRYQEYEDGLPKYKEGLEKRYPQVCKRCAPLAQGKISRADYYASTSSIGHRTSETAKRGALGVRMSRDDSGKWLMRKALGAVWVVVYASLILQVAWHVYGMLMMRRPGRVDELDDVIFGQSCECIRDAVRLRFTTVCYNWLGSVLWSALLVSAALIWYNPGLVEWYHPIYRIEAVNGQREHFWLQVLLLAARAVALKMLSFSVRTPAITAQQLTASHAFAAVFILLVQWSSTGVIKTTKFSVKRKLMPRPDEQDVLGAYAGPEAEEYFHQPSSIPPDELFAREQFNRIQPFPINNLAPANTPTSTRFRQAQMPSPPLSVQTDDDGGDPMDLDDSPYNRSQIRGSLPSRTYNPRQGSHHSPAPAAGGWSGMRDSIFGIRSDFDSQEQQQALLQQQQEADRTRRRKLSYQTPVDPSPFRGRLPAAPMSMERRLRNPVTQLAFKETPVSKQQDFMLRMRGGIGNGKDFSTTGQRQSGLADGRTTALSLDEDSDFSPRKNDAGMGMNMGGLDLKPSSWHLASDQQATGLEDMFGGETFRIRDEPPSFDALRAVRAKGRLGFGTVTKMVLGTALLVGVVGWNIEGVRRSWCLWLVARMDDLGF